MVEHPPKEGVNKVSLPLVLEACPGADPGETIRETRGDEATGLNREGAFATAGRDVGDDIPHPGPGNDAVDGFGKFELVGAEVHFPAFF